MWRDIKRLTGKNSFTPINQIETKDAVISDPQMISENFAKLFANISSNSNYTPNFLLLKLKSESNPINYESRDHSIPYNHPITLFELTTAIHKNLRNASPGPDNIHAAMLKNLHPNAVTYLLALFNAIFDQATYPDDWKLAYILPLLKPNMDPSCPESYRPIALTSVMGKLFQKIINKRLLWFLDQNNLLSPLQYGFRKGRNTIQALSDLQNQIEQAFLSKAPLYTIFFDLQQAYPRVWRYYICKKLHDFGLKNNLPKILQSFLQDRYIAVRIQDKLSSPHNIENGVPQGEVLSVLLFLIAVNDLPKNADFPITQRLFADDYSISLKSSNPMRAHRLLQQTLDKISNWSSERGFQFSSKKTILLVFRKKKKQIPIIPPLRLQNFQISASDTVKFLGLHLDHKLSWIPHIKLLKAKCLRTTNILKYLSHPKTGCNRKLLLQLYKSLIRSQLDYGSPIYNLTCKTTLTLLDTIQSTSLRLVLGAFRTSPRLSLCAESAEPPLSYRRSILSSNFLVSLSNSPQLPLHQALISNINPIFLSHPTKHIRTNLESFLNQKIKPNPLLPILSTTPPWVYPQPNIRLDLTEIPKISNETTRQHITELLNEFPNHILCLTDGSKYRTKTAYAYSINEQITAHRIRKSASVYTAELNAILACVSHIAQLKPQQNYILLTDSLSSLQALSDPFSTNPIIQRIFLSLLTISSIKSHLTFIWIPGHINFSPHEAVDEAAKKATSLPKITDPTPSPAQDLKILYSTKISKHWFKNWKEQTNNKLRKIKKEPIPWSSSHRESRQEEVILSRLRIGHTRMTHSYLLLKLSPPSCPHCMEDNLTVEHFFICPALQSTRLSFKIPTSISLALTNNSNNTTATLAYLRSTHFYEHI